jgi:hypothetical protein
MEKKVGIFIKTYSNEKTVNERIDIVEELFISVMNNVDSNIIKILIVDKCDNEYHKQIINKYSNIFNEIIYNDSNKGIAACQNIGIRRLIYKYDIDIGFGCDDDILIFKNGINRYVDTIIKSGISHFCYFPYAEFIKNGSITKDNNFQKHYKDNILAVEGGVCGCFFSFTPEMIKNTGYFPELPYVYGGEHEVFTKNTTKGLISYDIISSNSMIKNDEPNIELNEKSAYFKSMNTVDKKLWDLNGIKCSTYLSNLGQYIPYSDGCEYIEIIIFDKDNIDNIISDILSSLYLNYMIILVNENNNVEKYKNKLYVKIIDSNIKNYLINKKNKTYILNKKIKINNNNKIFFIDNVNQIDELKKDKNIDIKIIKIELTPNINLLELQNLFMKFTSNKILYFYINKKKITPKINTFRKCILKGYLYKNSRIKIPKNLKIRFYYV